MADRGTASSSVVIRGQWCTILAFKRMYLRPSEQNRRTGAPSSHIKRRSIIDFSLQLTYAHQRASHRFGVNVVVIEKGLTWSPLATLKWIRLAFSVSSLDNQVKGRRQCVAPESRIGARSKDSGEAADASAAVL